MKGGNDLGNSNMKVPQLGQSLAWTMRTSFWEALESKMQACRK